MKFSEIKKAIIKYWNNFLEVLFPSNLKCLFCNNDIPDHDKQVYCDECKTSAPFNNGKRCKICDCVMEGENEICDACLEYKKHFDKAVAPMKYEGVAKSLILKLKNDGATYLAPDMARLMSDRLNQENFSFDLIIPVPLSPKSLAKRKYNQSKLLADGLGKIYNKPIDNTSLVKIIETKHQKDLNLTERKTNLKGAFKVVDKSQVFGKNILLVDDVVTTGATANECSLALKKYANHVYVISFARNPLKNK